MPTHIVMFGGEPAVARRFLKDSSDAYALDWDQAEETNEFIDAMTSEQLCAAIERIWGEWADFRREFADEIAAEAAAEEAQWWAEFATAARWRLYGSHMRPARPWVSCTATGPEAVAEIGEHVIYSHRHARQSWAEIAERFGVPRHAVLAWAIETRVRAATAGLIRPFCNVRSIEKES